MELYYFLLAAINILSIYVIYSIKKWYYFRLGHRKGLEQGLIYGKVAYTKLHEHIDCYTTNLYVPVKINIPEIR